MRVLSEYRRWLARKGRGIQFVIGVTLTVALSLPLAEAFQAWGAKPSDASAAATGIAVVPGVVICTPAAMPSNRTRWGRWLTSQRLPAQVAVRLSLILVYGVALFGAYDLLGMSRAWALGVAITDALLICLACAPEILRTPSTAPTDGDRG